MLWAVTYGPSKYGRGVFATKSFTEGELIERCPIILIPSSQLKNLDRTTIYNYYFEWNGDAGIALGLGSLYNHSYRANAIADRDYDRSEIIFTTQAPIKYGEEIFINYLGEYDSKGKLWFPTEEYPI